jgi:hypothetical protein
MSSFSQYSYDDQLEFIETFIDFSTEVLEKIEEKHSSQTINDSALLNYLLK